jgi:ketosteroid isomerase-like protein
MRRPGCAKLRAVTGGSPIEGFLGRYQEAVRAFSLGQPEGVKALYSQGDDATLANPFGPAVRGWEAVSKALDFASSRFSDGQVERFEIIATYATDDLVTFLATEHWQARVGDSADVESFELRVTSTLRREDDDWRLVHRHADPISTPDPQGPLRS